MLLAQDNPTTLLTPETFLVSALSLCLGSILTLNKLKCRRVNLPPKRPLNYTVSMTLRQVTNTPHPEQSFPRRTLLLAVQQAPS